MSLNKSKLGISKDKCCINHFTTLAKNPKFL